MAGPVAGVILPEPLSDAARDDVRDCIRQGSDTMQGDEFQVEQRAFSVSFGPHGVEAEDFNKEGLPGVIGWTPQEVILFEALQDRAQDHRILGELCLFFALRTGGLVDFCGALLPPMEGDVQELLQQRLSGSADDWGMWQPHFEKMIDGTPGRLYAVPYTTAGQKRWVSHLANAPFMAAWLKHPNFHMVK